MDIGVLCSDREGLSNASTLEYMAAGLPVVATSVGGTPELVDQSNGACTPAGDPAGLARALASLVSSPELRKSKGYISLQRARSHFSWEKSIAETEAYYTRTRLQCEDVIMSSAANGLSVPAGLKAVLFKSDERFGSFLEKLSQYGIATTVLDFGIQEWIDFDYSDTDLLIYYPSFKFSSNHPLALQEVYENLTFINSNHPHIRIFPDPKGIPFYSDKYRQYLFLKTRGYPIPETYPLFSANRSTWPTGRLAIR